MLVKHIVTTFPSLPRYKVHHIFKQAPIWNHIKHRTFPVEVKILIFRKIPLLYFKSRDLLMRVRKRHLCRLRWMRADICVGMCRAHGTSMAFWLSTLRRFLFVYKSDCVCLSRATSYSNVLLNVPTCLAKQNNRIKTVFHILLISTSMFPAFMFVMFHQNRTWTFVWNAVVRNQLQNLLNQCKSKTQYSIF